MADPGGFCHWLSHPSTTERCSLTSLMYITWLGGLSVGLAFSILIVAPESMLWECIISPQVVGNIGLSCIQRRIRLGLGVPQYAKVVAVLAVLLLSGSIAALINIMSPVPKHFLGQVSMCVSLALACSLAVGIGVAFLRDVVLVNCLVLHHRCFRIWQRHYHRPRLVHCSRLEEEAPGLCSICLVDLADEDGFGLLRLTCNHTFHEPCITSWLDKHSNCPVCRQGMKNLRACSFLYQGRACQRGPVQAWDSPVPGIQGARGARIVPL